jgi:2-polyprenyl-3-methyl-5-hydroxy-6-metoxy-1,4-benzoquinol methylase
MTDQIYRSGSYANLHRSYHVEDSAWKTSKIVEILSRNNIMPSSIVDVGCGAGEILYILQNQFPLCKRLVGYEISEQALELAQKRTSDQLSFILGDIKDNEEDFSLSLCIDVFEHVEDYMGFIKSLKTHAEYHVFHIPLDLTVQTVLRMKPIMIGRETLGHLHYFTKDTAIATLIDCGYSIVDWQYTLAGTERSYRSVKQRLAHLPRLFAQKINQDIGVRIFGGASLLVLAN